MDLLIRAQWRLVRRSFALWTILGFGITAIFFVRPNGNSTSFNIGDQQVTIPLLGILGAALGARLFIPELSNPMGMYWRTLPLSPRTLLWKKLGFGAGALAASMALSMLWTYTGLAAALRGLIVPDALHEPPAIGSWIAAYAWALQAFVATAYFALSFDRVAASREAGVPGFFLATYLVAQPGLLSLGGVIPAPLGQAIVLAVALAAIDVLWRSRAVVAGKATEPLRRSPRGLEVPLLASAQVLLVVVPLVAALNTGNIWPYFGVHPWAGNALLWLAIGVLLLPWSRGEIRRHGLRSARAAGALALNLTGVGATVWLAIRARRSGSNSPLQHLTPAVVLVITLVTYLGGSLLLGGQRYARAWQVDVDNSEIEVLINGEPRGQGTALGVRWGPRLGPQFGIGSSFSSTGVAGPPLATDPLRVAYLQRLLHESSGRSWSIDAAESLSEIFGDNGAKLLSETFGDDAVIELRYRGLVGTARTVSLSFSMSGFYTHTHLQIEPRFPALESLAAQLVAEPTDALIERAAGFGGMFLAEFMRQNDPKSWRSDDKIRPDLEAVRSRRKQVLQLVDRILECSLRSSTAADGSTTWHSLQQASPRLGQMTHFALLAQYVEDAYLQLRQCALAGPRTEQLWTSAAARGEINGILVAGLAQHQQLFEQVQQTFDQAAAAALEAHGTDRIYASKITAAWMMLVSDRNRAVPKLVAALDAHPDLGLAKVLAFSANHEADAALAGWLALSDTDLANRFAHDGAEARATLEKCRGAIASGFTPEELWDWGRRAF